jgi:2-polyprenyl-6-methoxyphenol hydroxylase-like FAD-dependent oxidoreductase
MQKPHTDWHNSDAAHSMTNHMAQGAATSMEDGAFLGRALAQVVNGKLDQAAAIDIYEKSRMPKAYVKQQVSFLNGSIWQVPDGPVQQVRWMMRPLFQAYAYCRRETKQCQLNYTENNFCGHRISMVTR